VQNRIILESFSKLKPNQQSLADLRTVVYRLSETIWNNRQTCSELSQTTCSVHQSWRWTFWKFN